ncbi:hypothetical protein J2853_007363 [Streptosporangium lutulentum]|uniref:Uncharacterized protein n=1 Tax=Streptosporangium lutulentum TaxID=1461250 RepID=A0ABT9QN49_9ACTN|nr:hypothetical protein [Streptosporangium lutulentum]
MRIYAKVRRQNGPDSSTAKHVAGAAPLPASNERIGAPLIMTASTTRKQPTPHIVLPSGPPRLTPSAATELLAILLEAHPAMLVNHPNAA